MPERASEIKSSLCSRLNRAKSAPGRGLIRQMGEQHEAERQQVAAWVPHG
jgi:hypothetical protein